VCELDSGPGGIKASEKFLAYSEEDQTCTVRVDFLGTPKLFPVDHNEVDFSVERLGDGQSEVTWRFRSTLKPWGLLIWPLIRVGFGIFIGQILDELKFYVENDRPHPRKVKALKKTPLANHA